MTEATGVGARLRQAREEQGLAIDDVALQLKFAPRQIEFLEQERFDRLPGPTIARGMVRNSARLLKLDPEPLVGQMGPRAEPAAEPGQIAARFRREVPFSDSGRRSTLLYAGFSIGLLALVGFVAYEWQQQKATPQFVAPLQERTEPPGAEPAPAVAQAPAAEPRPAEKQRDPEKPALAGVTEKAAAENAEAPLPAGAHRNVLRTAGEAWIEIKDGSGRTLIASLNAAGTERSVRGQPPFELVIGNASTVTLVYDGKPVDLRPYTKVQVARFTLK